MSGGPDNGAYGLYPVQSHNVLVEGCEVSGAIDAGIYAGQSTNIIMRDNVAYANVSGIELDNTSDSDVYGNEVYDNGQGILLITFQLLEKKDMVRTRVFDNIVRDNNHPIPPGISRPIGSGIFIQGADSLDVYDNTIKGNGSSGIAIISNLVEATGIPLEFRERRGLDPETDPYSESVTIHDNTFESNGQSPVPPYDAVGGATLEDILWDGYVDAAKDNSDGSLSLCIQNNGGASFRSITWPHWGCSTELRSPRPSGSRFPIPSGRRPSRIERGPTCMPTALTATMRGPAPPATRRGSA